MSLNSKYYDQPEGKDLSGKMIATNKAALTGGLIWSIYDVVLFSKPQGYLPTIGRIASITGPFMGIATAFTLGTYTATNVRGKDDTYASNAFAKRKLVSIFNLLEFQDKLCHWRILCGSRLWGVEAKFGGRHCNRNLLW